MIPDPLVTYLFRAFGPTYIDIWTPDLPRNIRLARMDLVGFLTIIIN